MTSVITSGSTKIVTQVELVVQVNQILVIDPNSNEEVE